MDKREYNYDLLRVASMIAVILIHVSGTWVHDFSAAVSAGGNASQLQQPMVACMYNTLSRFAVPCFLMLSGAFVLADDRNAEYTYFYKKSFQKIGLHTIVFSVLYILYRIPTCFIGEKTGAEAVWLLVADLLHGEPFYHMWYLFMLIPLYAISPVLIRYKNSISPKTFCVVSFVCLVWGTLSRWTTSDVTIHWNLGQSFEYLGYFLVGFAIRSRAQKNNIIGIVLIAAGLIVEALTGLVNYHYQIVCGIAEGDLVYRIVAPYTPSMVLASVLIFAGFSRIQVKKNPVILFLSEHSFVIYLLHAGAWDVINKIFMVLFGQQYISQNLNNVIWIPIFTVVVLILSIIVCLLYQYIFGNLTKRLQKK